MTKYTPERIRQAIRHPYPGKFMPMDERDLLQLDVLKDIAREVLQSIEGPLLDPNLPKCSHGFVQPHEMGGKTGFNYDVAVVCDEWESKGGLIVTPYRLKERK